MLHPRAHSIRDGPLMATMTSLGSASSSTSTPSFWTLKIPNIEIEKSLEEALRVYYQQHLDQYADLAGNTRLTFKKIFNSKREELKASMEQYLMSLDKFAKAAYPIRYYVTHTDLLNLVCGGARGECTYRLELNILHEFEIKGGGKVDFCALYTGESCKIAIIMEVKVNESIEKAKKQILNCHYIHALKDESLKGAETVIIVALALGRPKSLEDVQTLQWELAYTVHKVVKELTEITLDDEESWIKVEYPTKSTNKSRKSRPKTTYSRSGKRQVRKINYR